MNGLLNRIFGLASDGTSLGFGSPDAKLSFVHPMRAWIIAIVLGALIFAIWWSYRSVPGSLGARLSLATLRLGTLAILLALSLGPMIEQASIHTEQDWVMVLLDRSGSLSTRDVTSKLGVLESRQDQLSEMLATGKEQWDMLSERKHVVWMGFGDTTNTIAIGAVPSTEQIGMPKGRSTQIGRAIKDALRQAAARPISSIVIASDGRSFDAIAPEVLGELKRAQVPIFVVPLGDAEPVRDLGIAQIEYPSAVFSDDLVPIRVRLKSAGISSAELANEQVRVELIDHTTGEVLDSSLIEPAQLGLVDQEDQQWVALSLTPTAAGDRELDVVLSTPKARLDLNATNNQSTIRIRIVDRPLRVLYIDGYPRWEQRYLKNLLLRERSISSSSMLLASSRRYIQEGDELMVTMPATVEDWEPIDVVIIGDVRSELFTDPQLETLLEHISAHGAGVLWIAGQSATPDSWFDTPLSPLLPMNTDAGGSQSIIRPWDTPVTMYPSTEAQRLGLLMLNDERSGWLDRLSDPETGWSQLRWALNLDETSFKPGVSVLAGARSITSTDQTDERPIITSMRYGAGRSVFVGTDEIWRWRYGRGEDLPERFWLPIIRSLGRATVDRRAAPAALRINPASPTPRTPAQLTLRIFDQSRIDSMPQEVRVEIKSAGDIQEPSVLTLRGAGDTRIGTWIPDQPGIYTISLVGLDDELSKVSASARVLDISDEQRTLDSDHDLLNKLAKDTAGSVITPAEFATIPELMPNRTRTIVSPPRRASLWDRPVVLFVLVLLLGSEWVGRRILRLA